MNSFLLALTAVLILVLSALFAAPLFIDWNDYRPVFETQASKLLGRDVKVGGNVHMVLLPAPELRFDDVKVADAKGGFDQPLLEARSIETWLNIGALMRGIIEARKITISEPVLRLALRDDGTGNWSDVGRAGQALPFVPKEVLLDEVSVGGGRIEVTRPGVAPLVLEDVDGVGSAASLSGPYKVSATYSFAGRPQELRFSTGASDPTGVFRLKSALRDSDRNITILLEGDVDGFRTKPSYDGTVIMRIASALPNGSDASAPVPGQPAADTPAGNAAPQPAKQVPEANPHLSAFELKGKLTATSDHAELPGFEIAVHSKGRSQMMKGKLALDFGAYTKAEGELAASWIDVDALLAVAAPANAQARPSAAGVLNTVAEKALEHAQSIEEGALSIKFDQASIGGDLVGGIDLAVGVKDGAVTIDSLTAELPGENNLKTSGRLTQGKVGPVFEGPVTLDGSKLRTLLRWAAGDRDMSGQASVGAFTLSAKTTIGSGDLKLEGASGELSGTKFNGSLHYRGGEQRIVDLTLDSDRLDLREVMGNSAAWRSWLPDSDSNLPSVVPGSDQTLLGALRDDEVNATLRVGELLLPNIPGGKLDAKLSLVKDTLDVERLDFAAPGAIALGGNGRIERLSEAPSGHVDLSLQATTLDGLNVTSELLGLGESVTKSKQLANLAPLDLRIGLNATRQGNATRAAIEAKGKAGGTDVAILAKATGDPAKLAEAVIDIDAMIDEDHPQALLGLLIPGFAPNKLTMAGADQGKFTVKAQGVPSKSISGRAELSTAGLQLVFDGQGASKPDGLAFAGQASAKSNYAGVALALLGLGASPSAADMPLDLSAHVSKSGTSLDFNSVSGQIAGSPVQGNVSIDMNGEKQRFSVNAKAASASLPALLGSLVAWQRTPSTEVLLGSLNQSASEVWPARGFALEPLGKASGDIKIEAKTLTLGAPVELDHAVLTARVDQQGLSITDLQGDLFGGSFDASGTLVPKGIGAELKLHAELAGGHLDQATHALAGRVLAKGPFTFAVDVAGEGLSPPGLIAGLNGDGALFLDPGALQTLSPEPLKRVAADANEPKKLKLDKDQIAARMRSLLDTLTKGTYTYASTALPFEVKSGTLKFAPAELAGKGVETSINGYVELASLRLDSEWAMRLSGVPGADMPAVNLVFAGSLRDAGTITPQIDTAPMENFLTVTRMQADVERLETLDVSGRNQPQADDQEALPDESAKVAEQADEPFAKEPATPENLAALKAAVEQRAADRAAEAKRLAAEKAAEEERAAEQAAAKKRAAEKAAAEKAAAEKAAADKEAADRAAAETAAAEQAAAEKRAADKAAKEKLAAEKAAAKKAAAEKRAAEKAAAEQAAAVKRAAVKAAKEKAAAEKAAAEQAAAEKRAAEKAAAEQAAAEKAAAEKAATATPQVPATVVPRSEANGAAPAALPSARQEPEQLPWSKAPPSPAQAAQPAAPAADAHATPAAAADDSVLAPAPVVAPRKRPSRPPPAPDDWKKGISIFGGG